MAMLPANPGSRIFLRAWNVAAQDAAACPKYSSRYTRRGRIASPLSGRQPQPEISHVSGEDAAREARSEALTPSRSP